MSKSTVLLAALVLVSASQAAQQSAPTKKVMLRVMYESLCPDSIQFIKEQLAPTFETLGSQRMVVEFVPYGKASTHASDTGYAFRCQHGPSECRGNKLQACGLARLLGDNKKQVKFVQCVMSQTNPSVPSEKCMTEVGLSAGEVKDCASGREGQVLLAGMGERTPRDISFVPTVNFNGKFSETDQDQALSNLLHVVCDKLAPNDRPEACKRKKGLGWFFWG
ncbi:GILT-like protein 1 [Thrips palmi]|uniref:GILT-like protein 1 n=1 Tax=Thrips palmi TaxID=161013 RepID=A0A6P8YGL5_THRPL|nr:GILT-like protein 1 [Thrips palmi]